MGVFFCIYQKKVVPLHAKLRAMRKIILINVLVAGFLLGGCTAFEKKQQVGAAVELNGQYIYYSTLNALTLGLDSVDSARVSEQYIRQWAEDLLVYAEGEKRLSGEDHEAINKMVEEYKQTLLAQAYERKLIDRHMDKTFPDSAVLAIYEQMPERFMLDESLMKGIIVVVPKDAPKLDKLRKQLAEVSLDDIEKYAYQSANGYELFIDKWLTTTQIISRIPMERAELENKLRNNNHIEYADSTKIYMLQVTDKHMRGEAMPIEYARPMIEKILMNARQVEFLHDERKRMYEEAVREEKIHFFKMKN